MSEETAVAPQLEPVPITAPTSTGPVVSSTGDLPTTRGSESTARFDALETPSAVENVVDEVLSMDDTGAPKDIIENPPAEVENPPTEKPPVEETPATTEVTPQKKPTFPAGSRDYTQFPESIRDVLKRTTNTQFAEITKLFGEFKNTNEAKAKLETDLTEARKGGLPQQYYEHPEAYTLSKEYKDLSGQNERINFEEQHWANQLARLKRGQDWVDLDGYDSKTGRPITKTVKAVVDAAGNIVADVENEIAVSRYLQTATAQRGELSAKLQFAKQQFTQQHQGMRNNIAAYEAKSMPQYEKPTGEDAENIKQFRNSLPQAIQDHPLASLVSKGYALALAQQKEIASLRTQLAAKNTAVEDRKLAGPGPAAFKGTAGKVGEGDMLDMKMFGD